MIQLACISAGLFRFPTLHPAARATLLFTFYLSLLHTKTNAKIERIEAVVGRKRTNRLAEVVLVAAAHSHMNVLVAQEIIVTLD